MSIKPVDLNAMMQNSQAPTQIAHHEDNKAGILNAQMTVSVEQKSEDAAHQVQEKTDADGQEYSLNGGNGRGYEPGKGKKESKKKKNLPDGTVRIKGTSSGFNITI